MIQEMTEELAESFGLTQPRGALVVSVEKDGPADKAGIEVRDVILKFDGKDIAVSSDLPRIVGNTKPKSKVTVQVWRDGATKNLSVLIGEMPSDESDRSQKQSKAPDTSNRLGLALRELSDNQKKQLGVESGLVVEEVQAGIASRAGIRQGDVILGFNNQDVKTIKQFNQLLTQAEKGRNIALLIKRGDMTSFITMKLDD